MQFGGSDYSIVEYIVCIRLVQHHSAIRKCDGSRPTICRQRRSSGDLRFTYDHDTIETSHDRECSSHSNGKPHVRFRFEHWEVSRAVPATMVNHVPSTVTNVGISELSESGSCIPLYLPLLYDISLVNQKGGRPTNRSTRGLGVICGNAVPDRNAVPDMVKTARTSPRNRKSFSRVRSSKAFLQGLSS